jgi:DNA gyrase/topoisomerase IV subunit A
MNVNNLTESQINAELLSRHSRTSGTVESRRQRLQRFLDFEDQKERRRNAVNEARIEAQTNQDELDRTFYIETDTEVEREMLDECCDSNCQCDAALALMSLRNSENTEIARLKQMVEALDRRITELETADMPPLAPILQDSNPNWVYDNSTTSPYAWECTELN